MPLGLGLWPEFVLVVDPFALVADPFVLVVILLALICRIFFSLFLDQVDLGRTGDAVAGDFEFNAFVSKGSYCVHGHVLLLT